MEQSGQICLILTSIESTMITFIGEITAKLDAKGRLSFPATFMKQMKDAASEGFVVKRDIFEKCLVLYPMGEWERQNTLIRERTNPYNKEHARFLRMFFSGTAELNLDASNRILLPKSLTDYAGIESELVMAGQFGKIELWSDGAYKGVRETDDEFAAMAEKILGGMSQE